MENEKVITANELTKKFGDFTAVDKISFEVNKGEIFGFLGANGAGKTTAAFSLLPGVFDQEQVQWRVLIFINKMSRSKKTSGT